MLPRLLRTRALPRIVNRSWNGRTMLQRRTLIAPPKDGDGPLMTRRADRELPDIPDGGMKWLRTIPIFLVVLASSTLAIFNYQKSSSSVVSSTLYSLRTSPKAREYLGDEIYFAHKMPWIWGEMNQLHGRIDIQFEVKGTKASGTMRFTSHRKTRMGMFETTEWSLETYETEMIDGKEVRKKIDLLDGADPFAGLAIEEEPKIVGRGSYAPNLSG
ncbi:Cytochrome c oxidase assembly factor [Lachnellula occidentalis]|uniref:Cytochrome c oxidase assembly factor n=1 Tax=Lachnellula occidentalis TaxID=215460 RepID=A0A8H8S7F5_9HELO|nr:Cytochrome c oxidase assembly factor [Lachnellula occidentalis]